MFNTARGTCFALLCLMLALGAGCGSSGSGAGSTSAGSSSSSGASSSSSSNPQVTNGAAAAGIQDATSRCLAKARVVPDAAARRTAEEACKAIQSGNTNGVKAAARQQCVDAARQVPDPAARKQVEDACAKQIK